MVLVVVVDEVGGMAASGLPVSCTCGGTSFFAQPDTERASAARPTAIHLRLLVMTNSTWLGRRHGARWHRHQASYATHGRKNGFQIPPSSLTTS